MAFKETKVPELGTLRLYKRRGNRSLKLTLTNDGIIRVSLPTWVPYSAGITFAKSKATWIKTQQSQHSPLFKNGQSVGKAHRIAFIADPTASTIRTRIIGNSINIQFPTNLGSNTRAVQSATQKAVRRALKTEAEILLPQRLELLALNYNFEYNSVSTRYLKTRWGSCNQRKDIVLNIFLMQLPWHLIDYVLLHELTHTKVLHHGPIFWEEFEKKLPNAKKLRAEMRKYQPHAFINESA